MTLFTELLYLVIVGALAGILVGFLLADWFDIL